MPREVLQGRFTHLLLISFSNHHRFMISKEMCMIAKEMCMVAKEVCSLSGPPLAQILS